MLQLTTIDPPVYEVLQELFTLQIIRNNFALAGGTSLALQIGHRKSIDLDLFSAKVFNIKELELNLAESKKIRFKYIGSNSRMLFSLIDNSILYFEDAEHDPDIHGFPPFGESWNKIKLFITKICS